MKEKKRRTVNRHAVIAKERENTGSSRPIAKKEKEKKVKKKEYSGIIWCTSRGNSSNVLHTAVEEHGGLTQLRVNSFLSFFFFTQPAR